MPSLIFGSSILSTTDDWLIERRRFDAPLITLVKVYLTDPTVKTLYLATNFVETPDFQLWQGAVTSIESVMLPGSPHSVGPDLCSAGFSLASRHGLGFQVGTKNITNLFSDWRWIGAKVEIFTWSKRLVNRAPELEFTGVIQNYQVASDVVQVRCIQRTDWNRQVCPTARRSKYPRIPQENIGKPIPVVMGRVKGPGLRRGTGGASWATYGDDQAYGNNYLALTALFGGQLGIPGLVVDHGKGGSGAPKRKVLFASHEVTHLNQPSVGSSFWIQDDRGVRNQMLPDSGDVFNDSNGAGYFIQDDFDKAFYSLWPLELEIGATNPGSEPRYAMDQHDELSYALLDWNANLKELRWRLPSVSSPGGLVTPSAVFMILMYVSSTTLTNMELRLIRRSDSAEEHIAVPGAPGGSFVSLNLTDSAWGGTGPLPNEPWNFDEGFIRLTWTSGTPTGEFLRAVGVGLQLKYKPSELALNRPPSVRLPWGQELFFPQRGWQDFSGAGIARAWRDGRGSVPGAVRNLEVVSNLSATICGAKDNASGDYGGTANTELFGFPNLIHFLLGQYGLQTPQQIEKGSGAVGSFEDAKALFKDIYQNDLKCAIAVTDTSSVADVARRMAQSCLSWLFLSHRDDKWKLVPWRAGAGPLYPRAVYRDDLFDFHADTVAPQVLPSGIRVLYSYDPQNRQHAHECFVGNGGSGAGWKYLGIRHQYLTVVTGENDRINLRTGGITYTLTLPAGDYTDIDVVRELQAFNGLVNPIAVAHGFRIVTGENDRLDFNDGGTKNIIIPAGLYTGESLASTIQGLMNIASNLWSVTYARLTSKFTFSRSSGTAQLTLGGTAVPGNQQVQCAAVIGFTNEAHTAGSPYTSDFAVQEEKIALSASFSFELLWKTGADGSDSGSPRHASDLLGWDGRQDTPAAKFAQALSPKWYHERTFANVVSETGARSDDVIDGRAIYDTETALDLIRRKIDWIQKPRVIVRFRTTRMPDVERGVLVQFDDLDNFGIAFPKAGSNGLWTGKKFRVVSAVLRLGPAYEQEIEAVEND